MSPREERLVAENAAWAAQNVVGVSLAIVGGLLVAFARDTASGRPAVPSAVPASFRRQAIDAARGFLHPFAWWSE